MSTLDSTVTCQACGKRAEVNFAKCLREGWPLCCGYTMQLIGTRASMSDAVAEAAGEGLKGAKRLAQQEEA